MLSCPPSLKNGGTSGGAEVRVEEGEGRRVVVTDAGTVFLGAEEVHDGFVAEDGFAGFHEGCPLGVFGWGDEVLGAGKLGHADGDEGHDLDGSVTLVLGTRPGRTPGCSQKRCGGGRRSRF
jgi:hypothetical protein